MRVTTKECPVSSARSGVVHGHRAGHARPRPKPARRSFESSSEGPSFLQASCEARQVHTPTLRSARIVPTGSLPAAAVRGTGGASRGCALPRLSGRFSRTRAVPRSRIPQSFAHRLAADPAGVAARHAGCLLTEPGCSRV